MPGRHPQNLSDPHASIGSMDTDQMEARMTTSPQTDSSRLVDKDTGQPCPTDGDRLCTVADRAHRHVFAHMTEDQTPEQVIRKAAWQQTLNLYDRWRGAELRSRGNGVAGYSNLHQNAEVRALRTQLEAALDEHGFRGTYVDPLALSWAARQGASRACPPVTA